MPQKGRTPPASGRSDERRVRAALVAVEGISTELLEHGDLNTVN